MCGIFGWHRQPCRIRVSNNELLIIGGCWWAHSGSHCLWDDRYRTVSAPFLSPPAADPTGVRIGPLIFSIVSQNIGAYQVCQRALLFSQIMEANLVLGDNLFILKPQTFSVELLSTRFSLLQVSTRLVGSTRVEFSWKLIFILHKRKRKRQCVPYHIDTSNPSFDNSLFFWIR